MKYTKLIRKRILITAADEFNRTELIGILNKFNMNIDIAVDGKDAIDLVLKNSDYDLIIMDMQMPIIDGLTATKKIREINIHTPIIALTDDSSENSSKNYFKLGFNDFITKPFQLDVSYETMAKWLEINDKFNSLFSFKQLEEIFENNFSLYFELSNDFFERYKNITETILDKEYIHKLKGASGTIGFKKIMEVCVELNIHNTKINKELLIKTFKDSWEYHNMLYKVLPILDDDHSYNDFVEFVKLITENDTKSISMFRNKANLFKNILAENYDVVKKYLSEFNFKMVKSICEKYLDD
ncbi:MAG: response regulator [Spirochaetaceae bacterium]